MNFNLSEDHESLRAAAQSFLNKESDFSALLVPGADVGKAGYDEMWAKIVDLGWPGICIPEAYDGLGLTYLDLIMVVGEMGRRLTAAPLVGTLAGSWAIEHAGSEVQKQTLLPRVAEGSLKLALAIADPDGAMDGPASQARAVQDGDRWLISGSKSFVVDVASADKIVVASAIDGDRRFFLVDRDDPGVSVLPLDWRDITRQVGEVSFRNAVGELLKEGGDGTWPWVRDRLYVVLAAESAAGTEKVLEDMVEYAKQRVAFGRPIGGFQAIKHQLADIYGVSQCATAGVQYAAWALSEGERRGPLAAAMAHSYASEAYRDATFRSIQVFGAIGFTWEMPNHLYYKRARANAVLLGSPSQQREEVVAMLEAEQGRS